MSDPLSEERLREIAERCDWALSDERQSMARELLAAREQLRLADALAASLDECACVDRYGMRSPGHCRLCAYRAARGAR